MCDECMDGFFDYTATGCQKCDCEADGAMTCNPFTGVCQCLEGVTGERCDRCLPRWILVPNEGCRPCDNCVHILLDDLEFMDRNLTSLTGNLATVSVGVTAMKRLQAINDSVAINGPKIDKMKAELADDTVAMVSICESFGSCKKSKSNTQIVSAGLVKEEAEQFLTKALDLEQNSEDFQMYKDIKVEMADKVLKT
ncbi:laminin-like protein epi-1 [Ylistrum balloti]|uniref:laminin-like protein epi-1 n=1 Tax=Ylistrum balloti TaxID=509963 RepID=UPI002905D205|nr:laminin-like protein epi-1 [Ylistrum balloti]